MAISLIYIDDRKEQYGDLFIENFNTEEEKIQFINDNKSTNDKVTCHKAEKLTDVLLSLMLYYNQYNGSEYQSVEAHYKSLVEKFGNDLLLKEFPNEEFNQDLIDEIEELESEYWKEEERNQTAENDYPEGNPELDAAEDELRRWDDEDPTWRVAHDLD